MRPPFPECKRRTDYHDDYPPEMLAVIGPRAAWYYGPEDARASIVAGEGLWGDGLTTWEVWYPGDREPMPYQTAADIAKRMGRKETAPPVWL
jgi:hypothetical protein